MLCGRSRYHECRPQVDGKGGGKVKTVEKNACYGETLRSVLVPPPCCASSNVHAAR